MNSLKYMAAAVAAGGAAIATGAAASTIVTDNLNLVAPVDGTLFSYDITLAGAANPQFTFHGGLETTDFGGASPYVSVKHHLDGLGTARLNFTPYTTADIPSAGEIYNSQGVQTYAVKGPAAGGPTPGGTLDAYYHLTFDANGSTYIGTADIGGDHSLRSISYVDTAAAPEPESWALLVLGAGAMGAMMRRRRQLQSA